MDNWKMFSSVLVLVLIALFFTMYLEGGVSVAPVGGVRESMGAEQMEGALVITEGDGYNSLRLPSGEVSVYMGDGTGSMDPCVTGGDLLIGYEDVSFGDVLVGDLVVFNLTSEVSGSWVDVGTPVLHRVVRKDGLRECLVTRGDANFEDDGCIPMDMVISRIKVVVYGG